MQEKLIGVFEYGDTNHYQTSMRLPKILEGTDTNG